MNFKHDFQSFAHRLVMPALAASGMTIILPIVLFSFVGSAEATPAPKLLKKLKTSVERNAGYDRAKFNHWIDADSNSCDTRDEVLFRQNRSTGKNCDDSTGSWISVYDGERFTQSSSLDVDHMVPLAEAWGSGGRNWSSKVKQGFANDLYRFSLIAVSASSNRSKSDRDPSEWLPPKRSHVCTYIARWTAVKYRWKLTVDRRERRALNSRFKLCSIESLRLPNIKRASVKPSNRPSGDGGTDPRFDTCTEAISKGYGPILKARTRSIRGTPMPIRTGWFASEKPGQAV